MSDMISRADAIAALMEAGLAFGYGKAVDAIRALPAVEVGVKPLGWRSARISDKWQRDAAETMLGSYEALEWSSGGFGWTFTSHDEDEDEDARQIECGDLNTIEAAKAAAQADYEARIRSALTATPAQDCREHSGDTDCSVTAYAALARMKEAGE